jgi:hypothetical protein
MSAWLCKSCLGDGEVWKAPENGATCGRCGLLAMVPKPSTAPPSAAPAVDDGVLWKRDQVAQYLGMSDSWVKKASGEGLIPTVHVGTQRRYRPEVIRELAKRPEGLPSIGAGRRRK